MSERSNTRVGAIEAGGTKFVCTVADAQGAIGIRHVIPTQDAQTTLLDVRAFFESETQKHGPISALGIASFGPLELNVASPAYGQILNTPKPTWSGVSYREAFSFLGVPMGIDTDVNGAALGEWTRGAGRGLRTLAYVTVGTGIGGGILSEGIARAGVGHYEMGHIRVARHRTDDKYVGCCPYHVDCLEGLASGTAIKERCGVDLSQASGNAIALEAFYLGQLAATITLMHRPERIIIGGGVMKTKGLLAAVRQQTRKTLANYLSHEQPDVSTAADYLMTPALGDDAGITGAITLARRALVSDPQT